MTFRNVVDTFTLHTSEVHLNIILHLQFGRVCKFTYNSYVNAI